MTAAHVPVLVGWSHVPSRGSRLAGAAPGARQLRGVSARPAPGTHRRTAAASASEVAARASDAVPGAVRTTRSIRPALHPGCPPAGSSPGGPTHPSARGTATTAPGPTRGEPLMPDPSSHPAPPAGGLTITLTVQRLRHAHATVTTIGDAGNVVSCQFGTVDQKICLLDDVPLVRQLLTDALAQLDAIDAGIGQ